MTKRKPKEVIFEEGWADELNLTKEEYDILVYAIKELAATGEFFENKTPLDELPEEEQYKILEQINQKNIRH